MTDDIASMRASVERLTALVATHLNEANEQADRAESAEATIARLAMVVRAAEYIRRHHVSCDCGCENEGPQKVDAALSSLTAEDRRRAGIEG